MTKLSLILNKGNDYAKATVTQRLPITKAHNYNKVRIVELSHLHEGGDYMKHAHEGRDFMKTSMQRFCEKKAWKEYTNVKHKENKKHPPYYYHEQEMSS